jgi:predicted amidohydrolase
MQSDNPLKIAIFSLDIAWADKNENIYSVRRALSQLEPGTDIVVLPELFSTGYLTNPTQLVEIAEPNSGKTITELQLLAAQHNVAISGSFLAKEKEFYCNRGFFIEPSGDTTFYDKHHLFTLSGESEIYKAGMSLPPIIRFRGWNISIVICYDLRFPVWCRSDHNSYDLLIVPANWAKAREYAWKHLLIARAIENQAVVVGANRSGIDDYGEYNNTSYVFNAMGKQVSGDAVEQFVYATVDKTKLEDYRRRMPSGKDGDSFDIILNC